ncbi:MAG: response regulator transcription factor [Alphaproteobacteria bacterium]|nr:response regulator transcription factor [Alphaproteobacteria bacterium]
MRILIADDHELFLKGLEIILKDFNPEAELVKAKNYAEMLNIINKNQSFDLVLTDLAMPGGIWLEALKEIHEKIPETPIIILSAVFEKEIVQKTLDLGASGYIPKTSSNAVILSAVNLVLSGALYIPAELLRETTDSDLNDLKKIEVVSESTDLKEKIKILSPRQLDVLKLIAEGKSNKQIAFELGLTEGTVKLHVTAILKILNVYNRTGAVAQANNLGLLKNHD